MDAASTMTGLDLRNLERRPQTAIWLALAAALLAHILLFLVLDIQRNELPLKRASNIEIQVQYEKRQPVIEPPHEQVMKHVDEDATAGDSIAKTALQPAEKMPPKALVQTPPAALQSSEPATIQPLPARDRLERLNSTETERLTRTILSRQFNSEPSAADKIFGPAMPDTNEPDIKEFHFPAKASMITMLDKPIPDLPFEYTPGLVHFAYAPGAKGDLQRVWDKITPEFGWRTNTGFEVRCAWVLVIVACGWGHSK